MRDGGTKNIPWSATELRRVEAHRTLLRKEAHAMFCAKFRHVLLGAYAALCKRKGWTTGRDGRIQKGNVPANKGKKMPYNANSARTQFKKGGRTGRANQVYKPIGTERVTIDGYIERKIHEGLPMQSRWRAVHLLNWEARHGKIPKGHCLKCKSGDKTNTDPSNWELIPRGALPFLNGHSGRDYDRTPSELKATILILARLKHAKGIKARRRKEGKQSQPESRPTRAKPYREMSDDELRLELTKWEHSVENASGWTSAHFAAQQVKAIVGEGNRRGLGFVNNHTIMVGP
jgi:hypothetical protein